MQRIVKDDFSALTQSRHFAAFLQAKDYFATASYFYVNTKVFAVENIFLQLIRIVVRNKLEYFTLITRKKG